MEPWINICMGKVPTIVFPFVREVLYPIWYFELVSAEKLAL
jgi:hypothetical protein